MYDDKNLEQETVYVLPQNFSGSGYILNGTLKTRNVFEAVIVGLCTYALLKLIPIESATLRITIYAAVIGPIMAFFIAGLRDQPASAILFGKIRYMRTRTIMHYNHNAEGLKANAIETIMQRDELPAEKIQHAIKAWREARMQSALELTDQPWTGGFLTDEFVMTANAAADRKRREKPLQETQSADDIPAGEFLEAENLWPEEGDSVIGGDFRD